MEPLGTYEDIAPRAETIQLGSIVIKVAALDDLIRIKSHLGRPKDRDSLMHLKAIKRVRESENARAAGFSLRDRAEASVSPIAGA